MLSTRLSIPSLSLLQTRATRKQAADMHLDTAKLATAHVRSSCNLRLLSRLSSYHLYNLHSPAPLLFNSSPSSLRIPSLLIPHSLFKPTIVPKLLLSYTIYSSLLFPRTWIATLSRLISCNPKVIFASTPTTVKTSPAGTRHTYQQTCLLFRTKKVTTTNVPALKFAAVDRPTAARTTSSTHGPASV